MINSERKEEREGGKKSDNGGGGEGGRTTGRTKAEMMVTFLKNAKGSDVLHSWAVEMLREKWSESSKNQKGLISVVRCPPQPPAITILRRLRAARFFHYRGSKGSLTSSPHLGLKQAIFCTKDSSFIEICNCFDFRMYGLWWLHD